jgi:hypothetical protein
MLYVVTCVCSCPSCYIVANCVYSCPSGYSVVSSVSSLSRCNVVWPAVSLLLLVVPLIVHTLTTLSVAVQYITSVIGEWMSAEKLWFGLGIRN